MERPTTTILDAAPLRGAGFLAALAPADATADRARRVVLMIIFIWILNIFDLSLTILAHEVGGFREVNPIARDLLYISAKLVFFKLSMVGLATFILLAFRRYRLTEFACWGLCCVYTALAFRWMAYYAGHA
ncbi:MAG: DUF5658 family protein [Planctomycetota bacterium]|nr:DUF5658 family protein [Planctomycetota bacterium]